MIKKPAYSGSFYPADPGQLSAMIDEFIKDAGDPVFQNVAGVVAPHAGYYYSGRVAGYAYRELVGCDADVVVVLAPSHTVSFNGAALLEGGEYETPLGSLMIDEKICADLLETGYFKAIRSVHNDEHSLEVQVPFIQRVLPAARLVPVIIGTVDPAVCLSIAEEIIAALKSSEQKAVVVVSTDLSHRHPHDEAVEIDRRFIDTFKLFDEKELSLLLRSRQAEACGEAALLTGFPLMRSLGAKKIEVLCYATSGDVTEERSNVVGYLSAAAF